MRLCHTIVALAAAAIGLTGLPAVAQTSAGSISLQASLAGVPDGPVNLTIQFYDDPTLTSGHQVGAAVTVSSTVASGVVSVPVPIADPGVFNGQSRWMGIKVGNAPNELSPRTLVTSVPYAMAARDLQPVVGGTDPRVTGTLRATKGFLAEDGELNSFSFVGRFRQGYYPNWNGTGREADFYRLIGQGDMHSGFGVAAGQDIASPVVWMYNQGGNAFKVVSVDFGRMVRDGNELFSVSNNGETRCRVLTITGADLAEKFDIAAPLAQELKPLPGMVVSMDPRNPGKLAISTTPYDKRVAGVISGANGLDVGVVLGKGNADPLIDGEHAVAMTGRVWVFVDESTPGSTIEPGDRLTTSGARPGYAMKVMDETKAAGAVIGKAMTGVDSNGMVQVLVNLQ